jgi:SRSO17 transposase
LHFVANASWSDEAVLARVREIALPAVERQGPIEAWIIDDTGFPKKGKHSVGVARQYCGQLGKQDNCQVVVSLSVANHDASLPISHRLYLPEAWAFDPERRDKARVPGDIVFRTKPEMALNLPGAACVSGVRPGIVLADPAYGNDGGFRAGITTLGLSYSVGIQSTTLLWKPNVTVPPRKGKRRFSHARIRPYQASAKELALSLPSQAWHEITWRIGGTEPLRSRFARPRVSPAGRVEPRPEE